MRKEIVMWILFLVILGIVMFCIWSQYKYQEETNRLNDPTVPEAEKEEIRRKRAEVQNQVEAINKYTYKVQQKLACQVKLEGVYGTYQDTSYSPHYLAIEDSKLVYVERMSGKVEFSIPFEAIHDVVSDTSERLTATRMILVGALAFALKKKTYYIVVNYNDPITKSIQSAIFTPKKNEKHDVFVNNILIERNKYLMSTQ